MKLDVSLMIDEGYASVPVKRWPSVSGGYVNRRDYFSASESGKCRRLVKYSKEGTPSGEVAKQPVNYGYFARGDTMEEWAVAHMQKALPNEVRLSFAGADQRTFTHGLQSGTPDGLFWNGAENWMELLEIKSIDPRTNASKLPKDMHISQVQQNMDLMEQHFAHSMLGAHLIYIDASNWKTRYSFYIEPDYAYMDKLEKQATEVMTAESPDNLPPDGIATGECKFCDYKERCNGYAQKTEIYEEHLTKMEQTGNGLFK